MLHYYKQVIFYQKKQFYSMMNISTFNKKNILLGLMAVGCTVTYYCMRRYRTPFNSLIPTQKPSVCVYSDLNNRVQIDSVTPQQLVKYIEPRNNTIKVSEINHFIPIIILPT
jgi:hypothetical protein